MRGIIDKVVTTKGWVIFLACFVSAGGLLASTGMSFSCGVELRTVRYGTVLYSGSFQRSTRGEHGRSESVWFPLTLGENAPSLPTSVGLSTVLSTCLCNIIVSLILVSLQTS